MSRFIIIDGPEKAGKSTLCESLHGSIPNSRIVHWGQVSPDDRVYSKALQEVFDSQSAETVIWDRSWASEYVYGKLLNRQRRGATNPWLMQWLHGRAIVHNGLQVMLLPDARAEVMKRRDDTDLPVNPQDEIDSYLNYATAYRWNIYYNNYTPDTLHSLTREIKHESIIATGPPPYCHPRYFTFGAYGVWDYPVNTIVVGEARNKNDSKSMPGAWMPFTSKKMCAFVQQYLGDNALKYCWTNAEDIAMGRVPKQLLLNARRTIAFGEAADKELRNAKIIPTYKFAHPGYFARWNTDRGRASLAQFETGFEKAFNL